jgi:hypothetical protein
MGQIVAAKSSWWADASTTALALTLWLAFLLVTDERVVRLHGVLEDPHLQKVADCPFAALQPGCCDSDAVTGAVMYRSLPWLGFFDESLDHRFAN